MFSLLLRGFVLGFAVAASPGPIFFLCVRRTIVQGRLAGLFSGFGVATADGFYAAIATFGVVAATTAFTSGRRPLTVVGGAVLVALGVSFIRSCADVDASGPATGGRSAAWAYASTLGLTITNPATIVSFAALAATLGIDTHGSVVAPLSVVAGVLLGSAAWWCLLVLGVSTVRTRITPRAVRAVGTGSGLVIMVLGILAVLSAFSR